MTLLAGAFSCRGTLARPEMWLSSLSSLISRQASDERYVVRSAGAVMIKVDIGAYGTRALLDDGTAATFVAGEPIVEWQQAARDRVTDTAALHQSLLRSSRDVLVGARGQFAVAHHDRAVNRLVLATDAMGIRGLYWWTDGDTVVYSSTLRVLEECPLVRKQLDLRGLAEQIAIGYPLANRTPYEGVSMLGPAEMIEFTLEGISRSLYWRWQDVPVSDEDAGTLSARTFESFRDAVRLRLRSDRATSAFLSGGLDTRVIVSALRADRVDVHTFNFASEGTQERVFAGQFAMKAETVHEEREVNRSRSPAWVFTMAGLLEISTHPIRACVERPNLVFSGEGGSSALGLAGVTPEIEAKMVAGDVDDLLRAYTHASQASVPTKILHRSAAALMSRAPLDGVAEELAVGEPAGLPMRFHLYFLRNNQRRGIQPNYEQIDLHRLEFLTPFFDSDFLRVVMSIPLPLLYYHRFYNEWLHHFPEYVLSTPWQSYPGHVPSPVQPEGRLVTQWDKRARDTTHVAKLRRQALKWALRTVTRDDFPSGVMRRGALLAAATLHATGVRDVTYLLQIARTIQRYAAICHRPTE
ncbi:MAG: asparagine synthase-related protein [Gemmatimonadaceae bacterium]